MPVVVAAEQGEETHSWLELVGRGWRLSRWLQQSCSQLFGGQACSAGVRVFHTTTTTTSSLRRYQDHASPPSRQAINHHQSQRRSSHDAPRMAHAYHTKYSAPGVLLSHVAVLWSRA